MLGRDDRSNSSLVERDRRVDDRLGEDALLEQPLADRCAIADSPIITGVIGVSETPVSKPSRFSSP